MRLEAIQYEPFINAIRARWSLLSWLTGNFRHEEREGDADCDDEPPLRRQSEAHDGNSFKCMTMV